MKIEGTCRKVMKAIYDKHMGGIILNGQILQVFFLISETKQEYLLSPPLFNTVLEDLVTAIKEQEEIKGIQVGKEEVKLSLFANDMILYIENPKHSTQKLLELINEFRKQQDKKLISRKQLHFYT